MSDVVWNDTITVPLPFSGQLEYKNTIIESYSGVAQAFNHTEHDRMIYISDYTALTRTERDTIFDFIKDRKGAYDEFLFEDIADNFVSRTSIGTGSGVASDVTFQLIDSKDNKRWDPKESPIDVKIWVGGVLKTKTTDYSIDYTRSGLITFVSAPALSANIEAEFYFRRRVRFTEEIWEWLEINYNNLAISGLRFKEVIVN